MRQPPGQRESSDDVTRYGIRLRLCPLCRVGTTRFYPRLPRHHPTAAACIDITSKKLGLARPSGLSHGFEHIMARGTVHRAQQADRTSHGGRVKITTP